MRTGYGRKIVRLDAGIFGTGISCHTFLWAPSL